MWQSYDHGARDCLRGCSTSCTNSTRVNETSHCLGISCCQTAFPYHVQSYSMNVTGLERHLGGSAFLVDKESYDEGSFSSGELSVGVEPYVPISLFWTLTGSDINEQSCCHPGGYFKSLPIELRDGISVDSSTCYMEMIYEGNPFLPYGCNGKYVVFLYLFIFLFCFLIYL